MIDYTKAGSYVRNISGVVPIKDRASIAISSFVRRAGSMDSGISEVLLKKSVSFPRVVKLQSSWKTTHSDHCLKLGSAGQIMQEINSQDRGIGSSIPMVNDDKGPCSLDAIGYLTCRKIRNGYVVNIGTLREVKPTHEHTATVSRTAANYGNFQVSSGERVRHEHNVPSLTRCTCRHSSKSPWLRCLRCLLRLRSQLVCTLFSLARIHTSPVRVRVSTARFRFRVFCTPCFIECGLCSLCTL